MLITLTRKIGQGSHSTVYEAYDDKKHLHAVKLVTFKKYGNPIIMETIVTSSFDCPHLHKANFITTNLDKIYLISDLATADLQSWLRKNPISVKEATKWIQSIAIAIDVLHSADIVHADVKASNLLLYPDGNVKLADFTLSSWKWSQTRGKDACTVTHRPIEVWCKQDWNESVDIWAFGCTIYEICTNGLLFPVQYTNADAYINAIIDWSNIDDIGGNSNKLVSNIYELEKAPCNYNKIKFSTLFKNKEYSQIKTLLHKCLTVDAPSRINSKAILQFFHLDHNYKPIKITAHPLDRTMAVHWQKFSLELDPLVKTVARRILELIASRIELTQIEMEVAVTIASKFCGLALDPEKLHPDYSLHENRVLKLLNYQFCL